MQTTSYSLKYQDASSAAAYDCGIYASGSGSTALWEIEQRVLDKLLACYCSKHSEADALDFACGAGRILVYLQDRVRSLVGVDISEAMLERAKMKVRSEVQLICADIASDPTRVPGNMDLVTSFRFLLLAEPELRLACLSALVGRMRSVDSVLILNSHGNPLSYRAFASLRNRLLRRGKGVLPAFGLAEMRNLARDCGLRIIGATGMGFVPGTVGRLLPRKCVLWIEGILAGCPLIWRFGTNLFFVCRIDPSSACGRKTEQA